MLHQNQQFRKIETEFPEDVERDASCLLYDWMKGGGAIRAWKLWPKKPAAQIDRKDFFCYNQNRVS